MGPPATQRQPVGVPVLAVENLTVTYGRQVALYDIDLQVDAGTSVALIGPNGSGKTTLLHAIAGLVRPTSGRVDTGGRRVAYVTQRHGHREWMPLAVREVLAMGSYRRLGLLGRRRAAERTGQALAAERLEVTELLGRQFGELSGGQRQRVLVAQALIQDPDLLLLDEPVTGLDLASQQRILDLIAEETARGVTVVLSTHHLDEARHCDLVVLLAGRLVASGPPDEVLSTDTLREAYTGRVLGDHAEHDHDLSLLIVDDHGHGTP